MTVGSGLGPDLLTLPAWPASARGLGAVVGTLPPVGSFTPPW